ncbi:MAG TPA: hypothetical protein VJ063_09290 [Verrucomicrobiae bacterium]|nr:hypothetical protein [Verrucomicrobiae bacterium]
MLDEILGSVLVEIVVRVLRVLFFPVALLVCTPFILIRGAVLAARHHARFIHAVADDYSSVDVYWWS